MQKYTLTVPKSKTQKSKKTIEDIKKKYIKGQPKSAPTFAINPRNHPRLISDIKKSPSSLSQDKQGNFGHTSKSDVYVSGKTKQRGKYYTTLKSFLKAPKALAKLAVVAIVGLAAAYVPPMLVHSNSPKTATISIVSAWGDSNIDVWWPTDGVTVSGTQPFKAIDNNTTVDKYKMVWQVDSGQQNEMQNSFADYPHKQSNVDLTGWTWKGSGPYTISFTAYDFSGNKLGAKYETIYINGGPKQSATTSTVQAAVQQASLTPLTPTSNNVVTAATVSTQLVSQTTTSAPAPTVTQQKLDVWWPTNGTTISGTTPFKVMLENSSVSDYAATWQVDGGATNVMPTNYSDYPHKESIVDVSGWTSKGNGPYNITFIAKNNSGQIVGQTSVSVTVQHSQIQTAAAVTSTTPTLNTTAPTPAPAPIVSAVQISAPAPTPTPSVNPSDVFAGQKLYVDPNTDPAKWAASHQASDPANAALMNKVASGAETQWFGNWNSNVQADVQSFVTAAANTGALPTIVAYNIPNRDCGGYSSGGASPDSYKQWIRSFAAGFSGHKVAVILEPDATALTSCLSSSDLQTRYSLLRDAVSVLKGAGAAVYIDAGHPNWISASDMASRLQQAGISQADGFALNVSNFFTTSDNISFGQQVSSQVGGKHFVIDTGRNGNGPTPDNQWCNPDGRALGQLPTTNTGNSLVDALLWVKGPGGSDGNCNGGPSAGQFYPSYALGLAQRASW